MSKRMLLNLAAALAALPMILTGVARAQTATPTSKPTPAPVQSVFSVNYYSNAGGSLDGTVRVVNQSGQTEDALIYVTDADQELRECCSCELTNGGTRTLSVNTDLTDNPANGVTTANGSVAIISSVFPTSPTLPKPVPELEAWETHPQNDGELTEDEFTPLQLSAAAEKNLAAECSAIVLIGSGAGICSCGTGD